MLKLHHQFVRSCILRTFQKIRSVRSITLYTRLSLMKLLLLGLHFQGPIVFKMSLDEKNCIPCKIEKSARLRIGDSNVEFTSGCAIMEVSLPTNLPCKIGFIKFKNSYVSLLSIRLKYKEDGNFVWKTVLKDLILMPSAHHELGSQDQFVVDAERQFTHHPDNVSTVRLILRQPSPNWSNFGLEDLKFYLPHEEPAEVAAGTEQKLQKGALDEKSDGIGNQRSQLNVNLSNVSEKFCKIVSMATDRRVVNALSKTSSSRFDVDGSYDLNLLSYT